MNSKRVKRLRPTFSYDWLKNENYKSWIREVPHDNSVYFCVVCNRTFCCSSRVSKHASSESHRINMTRNCPKEPKTTESRKREFFHSWLEYKQFKPWLEKVPNDPYSCFCAFCNATFRCGLDALKRHSNSKKHVYECQKRGLDIDFSALDDEDEDPFMTFENRKKIAEIKFATLIAEKNIPFQTAESILSFFQDLGKDAGILQTMTMNRRKGPAIINKVLYTREQERIIEALQSNKFSILIDETYDIINDKWMAFLVQYVDPQSLNVRTELLELIQLDASDCSAEKLFTIFRSIMKKKRIPFENILALSCDSISIMTRKYEVFKRQLQRYCENLIIMPCPCHASTLVLNEACKAIPEACEKILRKVESFISSSSKHACIFQQFQKSFKFRDNKRSVRLTETLWISHLSCVAGLNENWSIILKLLEEEQSDKKSKSETDLLSMMQNPEMQPYFLFLEYILDVFHKFNVYFLMQGTKVYSFQSAAENLLETVLRNVVKSSVLESAVSGEINPFHVRNRRFPNKVIVGKACKEHLDQLNQEGKGEIVKSVYANCLSFYSIAAKEIRERLFIKDDFLSKLRIFEPKFALQEDEMDNPNKSVDDLLFVAQRFGEFNEEKLQKEWLSLKLNFAPDEKEKIINLDFDEAWKTIIATTDVDGLFIYPTLTTLINEIRSLPNSNSDSKKMFAMLTDIKTMRRNKLGPMHVQALCVLKSSLKARGQTAQTMTLDSRHLVLMSSENLYNIKAKRARLLVDGECSPTPSDSDN